MRTFVLIFTLLAFLTVPVLAKDIWYCPMHPNYTSDKPGTCPICNMNLVLRKDDKAKEAVHSVDKTAGYVPVHLDHSQEELLGVKTVKVEHKPMTKTIRAAGTVAYDEVLYEAEKRFIEDVIAYERLDRRLNKGSYTIIDMERRLKQQTDELIHMGLTEPVIAQLRRDKVADHSVVLPEGGDVLVYVQIFEDDLGFVDVGQKAMVEVPAWHQIFEGTVVSVDKVVDPQTRSTRARVKLFKVKDEFKANMFVNVTMQVELNHALVVPRDAIMMTGTRSIAFVETKRGVYTPREVKTGWEADGYLQVKEGLKEGESVVSAANFLIDSESRLQAALEGMAQ